MPIPSDWVKQLRAFVNDLKAYDDRALGDEPFGRFVLTEPEPAQSWEAILKWFRELGDSWCFRGQREARWRLHTSLDRAVLVEYNSADGHGYYHLDREAEGRDLLFRFQQRAHQYIQNLPAKRRPNQLVRSDAAPWRPNTIVGSPFVALYFALEEEPQEPDRRSAVWAIDLDWLETKVRDVLVSEPVEVVPPDPGARAKYLNGLLERNEKPVVVSINPQHIDERMAAQQGFFLCKLVHPATFNQILMSMMIHPHTPQRPVIRKLEVDGTQRIVFLKHLREMNIHRASLFPGLDGFCQSLRLDLEIKAKSEGTDAGPSISDLRKMLKRPRLTRRTSRLSR